MNAVLRLMPYSFTVFTDNMVLHIIAYDITLEYKEKKIVFLAQCLLLLPRIAP